MANNLYNQLNQQNNRRADINSIIQEVKQSGMSAKDLFFKKTREMGIDPNMILSQVPNQYK